MQVNVEGEEPIGNCGDDVNYIATIIQSQRIPPSSLLSSAFERLANTMHNLAWELERLASVLDNDV